MNSKMQTIVIKGLLLVKGISLFSVKIKNEIINGTMPIARLSACFLISMRGVTDVTGNLSKELNSVRLEKDIA